jgi:hypothetical protein
MPHVSGHLIGYQSGGYFQPDHVPEGIDSRGGFILLKEDKSSPSAKESGVTLPEFTTGYPRISFDYSEVVGGSEFTAGYYYGVKNLREGA